jgi:hypothetical protein
MATLADSYALLDRACRDLQELHAKVAAYVESDPNELVMVPDEQRTMYEVRLNQTQEPDPGWGIDFGVIGGHLRSALDYIPAYLANPGKAELSGTQFPIFKSKADYTKKDRRGFTARDKMLKGVPGPLLRRFDQQQPYARRDDAENGPLALLVWITNRHKHRKLHPVQVSAEAGRFVASLGDIPTVEVGISRGQPIGGFNTKNYLFGLTPPYPEAQFKIDAQVTTFVGFGDRQVSTVDLVPVVGRVREIIEIFEPLAPSV